MKKWIRLVEYYHPDYVYVTQCVDGGHGPMGEAISDMVDRGESITYEQFMLAVGEPQMREIFSMYDWPDNDEWNEYDEEDRSETESCGLTLKDDYSMKEAFYRSYWYGIPCVYCVWSAVEFVFTRDGRTPEGEGIDRNEYLMSLD